MTDYIIHWRGEWERSEAIAMRANNVREVIAAFEASGTQKEWTHIECGQTDHVFTRKDYERIIANEQYWEAMARKQMVKALEEEKQKASAEPVESKKSEPKRGHPSFKDLRKSKAEKQLWLWS